MSSFTESYKPLHCTLGTDPEIFAVDSKKRLLPAFNFLPHREESPSLYWDGFAMEGNVEPRDSYTSLGLEVSGLIQRFDLAARQANGHLTLLNAYKVPQKQMAAATDEQIALGCMPSFNAYGLEGKIHETSRKLTWRFAGGHIHIGNNAVLTSPAVVLEAVKAMDAVVGVASVALTAGLDHPKRREFYGLPGEFRRPAHGVEYRVLSNFWLISPSVFRLTFDLAKRGFELGVRGLRKELLGSEEEVVAIIRNLDVNAARTYITRNSAFFKWCLQSAAPALSGDWGALLSRGVLQSYNIDTITEHWQREQYLCRP